ncbi:MAG TPA: TIGR03435 family protein [Vicinamibacterales bacterium]|jgi:bla regulator protein blaR1|nr:TIGR03435 family protein [Vicinamibacterales bacterium]
MRQLMLTLCFAGAVAIVVPAQEKDATFEVASVKPNKSGDTNGMLRMLPGGRVSASNMPVRPIITFAYQLAQYQLVGGPGWLTTDRYDLIAKLEGDPGPVFAPSGTAPNPMQLALRNLLEDRFKLKVHRETREMDIYALVMAKPGGGPGPNLKPTTQDCAAAAAAAQRGAPPPSSAATGVPFCGIQGGPGRIRFGGLPASALAQAFSGPAGRMVVERTGLSGAWDFELNYAAEGRGAPGGADAAPADPNAPSLFTAIQEQLGLKLESTKGPVEVLVIDSVERPTEN